MYKIDLPNRLPVLEDFVSEAKTIKVEVTDLLRKHALGDINDDELMKSVLKLKLPKDLVKALQTGSPSLEDFRIILKDYLVLGLIPPK